MDDSQDADLQCTQGDRAKCIEEGVDAVVSTESHVIETTTEVDTENDPTEDPTKMSPSNNVEIQEEAFSEDDIAVTTAHEDTMNLAEQENEEMETSHVPDSLLDVSSTPSMAAHAIAAFIGQQSNNFLKGCKWYSLSVQLK